MPTGMAVLGGMAMGIREQVTSLLSLPKEVMLNLPQVILTGREEAVVENYKNIIEYSDTLIRINTSSGIIKFEGNGLMLKQITSESITISGSITKIEHM